MLQTAVNQAQTQLNTDKSASPVGSERRSPPTRTRSRTPRNNQASGTHEGPAAGAAGGALAAGRAAVVAERAGRHRGEAGTAAAGPARSGQGAGRAGADRRVATAQKTLAETILTSPASGTIATVGGSVGDTVAGGGASGARRRLRRARPGSGSASGTGAGSASSSTSSSSSSSSSSGFITLTNLDTLQVTAGFSESDAVKVKVGQPAAVTFAALPTVTANAQVVGDRAHVDGRVERRDLRRHRRLRRSRRLGEAGHDGDGRGHDRGSRQRAHAAGVGGTDHGNDRRPCRCSRPTARP